MHSAASGRSADVPYSFASNVAAREVCGAARFASLAAGQAVAVAHVAAHELGAAAKLRGRFEVPSDASEEAVRKAALALDEVQDTIRDKSDRQLIVSGDGVWWAWPASGSGCGLG